MKIRCFLPVVLAAAALLFVSCGEKKTDSKPSLELIKDGIPSFSIIRDSDASEDEKKLALGFVNSLSEKFGAKTIEYTDDFSRETDSDGYVSNDNRELLIGNTNRRETAEIAERLETPSDWAVVQTGNKVVVCGGSSIALGNAVKYFNENIANNSENGVLKIETDFSKVYLIKSEKPGYAELDGYKVVRSAMSGPRTLEATKNTFKLAEKYGTDVRMTVSAPVESDKEILIGETDSAQSRAMLARFVTPMDWGIKREDNKIVVLGGCAAALLNAEAKFEEMFVSGELTDGTEYIYNFPVSELNPLAFDSSSFVPSWNGKYTVPAAMLDFGEKLTALTQEENAKRLMALAHRGADYVNYPENSVEGCLSAIMLGADAIETDVRLTKDNVYVMFHDDTLDRKTDWSAKKGKNGLPVSSKISDWTYAELKQLNLVRDDGAQTEYKIPTYYETMLVCGGKIFVMADCKCDMFIYDDIYPVARAANALESLLYSPITSASIMSDAYKNQTFGWKSVYDYSKQYFDTNTRLKTNMTEFNRLMASGGKIRLRTWAYYGANDETLEVPSVWESLLRSNQKTLIYTDNVPLFTQYIAKTYFG